MPAWPAATSVIGWPFGVPRLIHSPSLMLLYNIASPPTV